MAHGTPASPAEIGPFYTRIRRGRPPEPAQLAELEGRYAAIGGVSPLAERTPAQVDGCAAALEARAPGRYVVDFGAKHTDPLIEDAAARPGRVGRRAGDRPGAHPARVVHGLRGVPRPGRRRAGRPTAVRRRRRRGTPSRLRRAARRPGARRACCGDQARTGAPAGDLHRALAPRRASVEPGDTYPEQLAESARLVAEAAGLAGVAGGLAERRPHPRAVARPRRPRRGAGPGAAEGPGAVDAVVVCPIGFVADHLEVLYDLDIDVAAIAADCGVAYARTASLNDDPVFLDILAGVIVAADRPL